jgi:hypothetical protein
LFILIADTQVSYPSRRNFLLRQGMFLTIDLKILRSAVICVK